jgi:hypothetical protein
MLRPNLASPILVVLLSEEDKDKSPTVNCGSTRGTRMKDRDWRRLLELMKEGTVVPVIGARLLVDADGTSPLTARVARRLLADYDMDIGDESLPPFRELSDVATRLNGKLRNPQDLYGDVDSAFKAIGMLEHSDRAKGEGSRSRSRCNSWRRSAISA